MKQYRFKTNGAVSKDIEHIVEYGYGSSLQVHLMWKLINVYDVVLDKNKFLEYHNKLEKFIENKYKDNLNGEEVISHFSSIDMEAELLMEFLCQEFGDKII